jgi:thiol-disulfide isomerase/thioredoxin
VKAAVRLGALVLVVLAVAFSQAFVRDAARGGAVSLVGRPAPALRLPDLDGREHDLTAEPRGWRVVNFWATWCEPCVREMPSLDRLHRTLASEGLRVVAVAVDERAADVRGFVDRRTLDLAVVLDPQGRTAAEWRVAGYPTTFVIDPAGTVREAYEGPADWSSPGALGHFRGLLASPP